ncbi:MAG: hypothetical protein P4L90_18320 [Rhodopila sp.]|nr:hypothetical protein [Rhodopila sp.]
MASFSWSTGTSGDWNTAADWSPAPPTVPNALTADVTIDATATSAPYTVTIGAAETITIDSLALNVANNAMTLNGSLYLGAILEVDGTLIFAPGSAGLVDGPLQNELVVNGGTIENAGTINAFVQATGVSTFTGTNGIYFTNWLQSLGDVTVDTKSIGEFDAAQNTLVDGIFEAKGSGSVINLGGSGGGLTVTIDTVQGPGTFLPGTSIEGWTQLIFDGPDSEINEWNGTAYVPVESTISLIQNNATITVNADPLSLLARNYTTTNAFTIGPSALFFEQGGTFSTGGLTIQNGGTLSGAPAVTGNVVNNGTIMASGGTMILAGSVTGTGVLAFDTGVGTLEVHGVSAGQTVVMNGNDTLQLDTPATFAGTIDAGVGDQIVLEGVTADSATLNNGTLVVSNGTQTVASLVVSGSFTGDHLSVSGSTVTFAAGIVAPTISGTTAGQAVTDQGTITPFSHVSIMDANIGQTETVTVTLSAATHGILTNLGGGSYNATTGVYTDIGSVAAITADLEGLVFTPTAHEVAPGQTVTTIFAINLTDTASAGTTDSKTSVIATADVVPPTISGTAAGQAVTDLATITPFTGVVIGDLNPGQTETVTVTLSAAANGVLGNLGGGSYDATTGIYTYTGSAAAATAALNGLVFTPTAHQVAPGQTVTTGFTISDTDTASASATDSTTSVITTAALSNFTVTDTTNNVTSVSSGQAYVGPVAGLQWAFITTTTDSLAITATAPNTFIRTGSGNDAIDVSHVNGTNVLDGSTGSNFLVGGTGFDTFFLDDRSPTADVFSTVVNFHSGDNATVWGITPSDFTLNTYNNQGAAGYTGLDFSFTAAGKPNANLVLTGYTSADLTNGKLTVTYGITPTTGGIPGSTYMLIHAN